MTDTKISDERLDELIANAAGATDEVWWLDDVADALTELKRLRHQEPVNEPAALRQPDTRMEGGDFPSHRFDGAREVPSRTTDSSAELGEPQKAFADTFSAATAIKAQFSNTTYTTNPTPEHVEGDVLSVGEIEALARRLRDYRPPALDPAHGREHHPICDEAADALTSATTRIQRAEAYREELMKLAAELGEPDDPFAAWEALAALKAQLGGTNG